MNDDDKEGAIDRLMAALIAVIEPAPEAAAGDQMRLALQSRTIADLLAAVTLAMVARGYDGPEVKAAAREWLS